MDHDLQPSTSKLLGYPEDARLLILNADDFGFCGAVNEGIMGVLEAGLVCSTSLMMPCPVSREAFEYLLAHSQISVGVHLTVISDPAHHRCGPLLPKEKVQTRVDSSGYFYDFDGRHSRMNEINLRELELEFRAQIESVLAAGLHPDHLDWHSLRIRDWTPIPALITRLAAEYGLALRVMGQGWIKHVLSQGLPCIDRDFLDSYSIDPAQKTAQFKQLLHDLPCGLNEWAVHPGLDGAELLSLEPGGNHFRQSDFDFLTSHAARGLIDEECILLIDYRSLQPVWKLKGQHLLEQ